jgi:hypothetical protein
MAIMAAGDDVSAGCEGVNPTKMRSHVWRDRNLPTRRCRTS